MSSWLIPTCTLCGLRFPNRALLELHIREDHVERNRPAEPDHEDSDVTGTTQLHAGGSSADHGQASSQPRTTGEVNAMMATQRPRFGRAMTVLRHAIGGLRRANGELVRASEAITRSARAPRPGPRPSAPTGKDAQAASDNKHADRAA